MSSTPQASGEAKVTQFPIIRDDYHREPKVRSIPWAMIAPHESQAMRNHCSQDLEALARRGGLSCGEAVAVLTGKGIRDIVPDAEAEDTLLALIAVYLSSRTPHNGGKT
jgi:hypothetical protein